VIELRTGLPGSGKSLSAVDTAMQYSKEGRRVLIDGINGIDHVATGTLPYESRIDEWRSVLQPGDVLIVDEVQRYLPKTLTTRGIPKWVEDFSVNRHSGIDLLFITQDAQNIDPYVRRLVNVHRHYVNRYGRQESRVYTWFDGVHDPKKETDKKRAERTIWHYPNNIYTLYKSAELHTRKKTTPRAQKVMVLGVVAMLIFAIVAGVMMYRLAHPDLPKTASTDKHPSAAAEPSGFFGGLSGSHERKPMTKAEWVKRFEPRFEGIPWSEPIFDDRKAESQPEVYCISVEYGKCRCHSEQGTLLTMNDQQCRNIALNGLYNPFRRPREDRELRAAPVSDARSRREVVQVAPDAAAGAGAVVNGSSVHSVAPTRRPLSAAYDPSVFGPRVAE